MALDLEKLEKQVEQALATITDEELKEWILEKKQQELEAEEFLGNAKIELQEEFSGVFCKGFTQHHDHPADVDDSMGYAKAA